MNTLGLTEPIFIFHPIQKRIYSEPISPIIDVDSGPVLFELKMGSRVASLLGYASDKTYNLNVRNIAGHRPNLSGGVDFLSVYCPQLSGGLVAGVGRLPLLRMLSFEPKAHGRAHFIFTDIFYLPLERRRLETLRILIRDQLGRKVLFREGKIFLTLHLRAV